ncbi:protein TPX2 isoform X2 [Diospyros lotus]|uniref:protein TPX2 isoform X2 n=1 Tax=Diospyros lotus TaxID=55363 RepID=UPI0022556650|nr:protein TPX2 isoform X2 [Diospyros lotus]
MDEEMEDSMELSFTVYEIDLDYEFDAYRYFDFTREESVDEAREAERWFENAGSYPPSPFVTQLMLREDILQETVNSSPKSKEMVDTTMTHAKAETGLGQGCSIMEMNGRGLTFYNPMTNDNSKPKVRPTMKPSVPRTSTLMKPTASQLAKQNQPRKVSDSRNLSNPFAIECQAAKRQKLEGGLVHKVDDAKQQSNLLHKTPRKDGANDENSGFGKLKITIPREPDLETAHRAQRTRPKSTVEPDCLASTFRKFKALPLNRKILEAPSLLLPKRSIPRLPEFQVFHLKTSQRAMHHTSAVSSSSVCGSNTDKVLDKPCTDQVTECPNGESRRLNFTDVPRQEGQEHVHNFKARPLNKKIFSSKGDMGVFRNSKKETTVPMEFNLHTEKRSEHNPPIELFNKLSLTELQTNAASQLKSLRPSPTPPKGSKENRLGSFQQEHEIKALVREKPPRFSEKQASVWCHGGVSEVSSASGTSRSLGIR